MFLDDRSTSHSEIFSVGLIISNDQGVNVKRLQKEESRE